MNVGSTLLRMVAKSISHRVETMFETIPFVGIYRKIISMVKPPLQDDQNLMKLLNGKPWW